MQDEDLEGWIAGLRAGDPAQVQAFCRRFGAALEGLARKHMVSALRQRVGPEDVVQSVYRTFLRRAADGQFTFEESADLWRLLCAITLTKVREQARHHLRHKRGLDREVRAEGALDAEAAREPTPAEAAEFSDLFERLLGELDDEERRIVELRLDDRDQLEIAEELGCSERTVRRILTRVRARLEGLLAE